ncbi:cleavage and polyadenylation specificity factor subunit 2, partial [Kipferlia bialata]
YVKILIDCGWVHPFDKKDLQPLIEAWPTVNLVLLSHSSMAHIGALPLLCSLPTDNHPPIYATKSTEAMGRLTLRDAFMSLRMDFEGRDPSDYFYPMESIDSAMDSVKAIEYLHETSAVSRVKVTAIPSYRTVGGTIWRVTQVGFTDVLLIAPCLADGVADRHLDRLDISDPTLMRLLHQPALFAFYDHSKGDIEARCGLPPLNVPYVTRAQRDNALMTAVQATIKKGGDVLLPVDTVGRALELLLVLYEAKHALQQCTLVLAGPAAGRVGLVSSSRLDDMASDMQSFGRQSFNPFLHLGDRFRVCTDMEELLSVKGRKVILATPPSLASGMCAAILRTGFHHIPQNRIILTHLVEGMGDRRYPSAQLIRQALTPGQDATITLPSFDYQQIDEAEEGKEEGEEGEEGERDESEEEEVDAEQGDALAQEDRRLSKISMEPLNPSNPESIASYRHALHVGRYRHHRTQRLNLEGGLVPGMILPEGERETEKQRYRAMLPDKTGDVLAGAPNLSLVPLSDEYGLPVDTARLQELGAQAEKDKGDLDNPDKETERQARRDAEQAEEAVAEEDAAKVREEGLVAALALLPGMATKTHIKMQQTGLELRAGMHIPGLPLFDPSNGQATLGAPLPARLSEAFRSTLGNLGIDVHGEGADAEEEEVTVRYRITVSGETVLPTCTCSLELIPYDAVNSEQVIGSFNTRIRPARTAVLNEAGVSVSVTLVGQAKTVSLDPALVRSLSLVSAGDVSIAGAPVIIGSDSARLMGTDQYAAYPDMGLPSLRVGSIQLDALELELKQEDARLNIRVGNNCIDINDTIRVEVSSGADGIEQYSLSGPLSPEYFTVKKLLQKKLQAV